MAKKQKKIEQPKQFTEKYEEVLIRQLFEEELSKQNEESPYFQETQTFHHNHRDGEWDVLLDEEIKYFDAELSYELTGYRPITDTKGLDFDPTVFNKTAEIFNETGKYTEFRKGRKEYNDFWNTQYDRCINGYTVGKYRITGDHYFFLNFYRMQTAKSDNTKGVKGRNQSFPSFAVAQYEFFHYLEMCEHIGKDCCMLKARALGFSEILACIGVKHFITTREYRTVYTAAAEPQLEPVLTKCWTQLNWLNRNTDGGMKRLRQKVDNVLNKRASLVDNEGTEYGRMSEILGIIADDPNKVRGDRTEKLIFEEHGSNAHAVTAWIKGDALVEVGGEKIGIKICGGTGGDKGHKLAGLSKIFSNPETYKVLPHKNSYTRDGTIQYTGFFIPAHKFSLKKEFIDHRGYTDSVRFKQEYEKNRALLEGSDFVDYCAEYCFTPDEALLKQGENVFDTATISDRLTNIRIHKNGIKPEPTALIWDKSEGETLRKIKAIQSQNSKILIVEPPLLDDDGNPFKNLYVAGIDSIDMGSSSSASDKDVSDFCIVIKKRIHGMNEPKYVAMYKDRPTDIRIAYDNAMKLLTWYNCQALLEYTKITIQTYFKEKGKAHLFMERPDFAISSKTNKFRKKKNLIGVPATESIIKHGLELINMYINDYSYMIDFDEMLEQMLKYSYADKRKFDIIAAMGMCEIGDEEMMGINPVSVKNKTSKWIDFGFYTDENGIKRRGAINKRI